MFRGRRRASSEVKFFSAEDPGLVPFVHELDDRVAVAFPEFVDGTAEQRLRLVPDQITGRGVELAAGASVSKDTPLAIYAGSVVLEVPSSDYVLALPPFRRAGHTWNASVGASHLRTNAAPPLINTALLEHTCHNATVRLGRPPSLRDCALPCAVALALEGLSRGRRLKWDHDGGRRAGNVGFTVDLKRSLELRNEGIDTVACGCQPGGLCPRGRWFRVPPP
jgi:hypothetical protein